jgi:hypothetical protein
MTDETNREEKQVDHRKIWGAGYHQGVKAGREEVMRMAAQMVSGIHELIHHIHTFNYADHWEEATASMCVHNMHSKYFEEFEIALCEAGLEHLINYHDDEEPKKVMRYVDWERSQRPRVRLQADFDRVLS